VTFVRFPRTPHLAWLGPGQPRDDKVLTPSEARELLAHDVIVEEKVDGANVGFSVDDEGTLRVQNRGSYVLPDSSHPQFKPLSRWLAPRRHALVDALGPDLILFGEWCYATHSVRYTRLPDWLLAFDVYDRSRQLFWNVVRRDQLAKHLDIAIVPRIASGRFDLADLVALLGPSKVGAGPAEGLYVRREEGDRLVARAKLARPEFVQAIGTHWSRGPLRTNLLK
jgi:RNA ligase-like protein